MQPSNSIWEDPESLPEPFLSEQPLQDWAKRLAGFSGSDVDARFWQGLSSTLQAFRSIDSKNEDAILSQAKQLYLASEFAHKIWDAIADDDDDRFFDFSVEWFSAFKTWLRRRYPSLEIGKAVSGQKFDMDTMIAEESLSGHRLSVGRPLSWAVYDASCEPPKILHRAKVVTN